MEPLEFSARTVDEAIQIALTQLDASREDVKVDVLSEGKPGLLGLGGEEAVIRVERLSATPESSDESVFETTKGVLEELLELMDVEGSITPQTFQATDGEEQVTAPVAFDIEGEDLGILIGRRGLTLAAFQYIVRLIISHRTKLWTPIVIDVEGYKRRRSEALQALAIRMAEQVKSRGRPFTLEPMPAYERRVIHLALADHPDVTTESTGEGDLRKVVILPEEH